MSGGSQYGNQVAYQNIIPTAVPLQIINQANAVQPGQQFILIDQEWVQALQFLQNMKFKKLENLKKLRVLKFR